MHKSGLKLDHRVRYHSSMGPVGHTVISTAIGASVWGATGSIAAGGVAVGVGVFVDVDHLVDLYQSWVRRRPNLVIVPFHGWEYSVIGLLILGTVFYHPIFLAAVLGHLGHVATDHFHNRLTPLGYFILYRVWVRFDAGKIAPGRDPDDFHHNLPNFFPFGRLWEPWYRRRIEHWTAARVNSAPEDDGTPAKE